MAKKGKYSVNYINATATINELIKADNAIFFNSLSSSLQFAVLKTFLAFINRIKTGKSPKSNIGLKLIMNNDAKAKIAVLIKKIW